MYTEGIISWEQFAQAMWEYHWTANSQATETSTTYYFYDSEGKLIRTETVTQTNKTESGTGAGSATEETKGEAQISVKTEGEGEVQGTTTTETNIYVAPTETPIPNTTTAITTTKKATLSVAKKIIVIKAGQTKTLKYSAKDTKGKAVKAKVSSSSNVVTAKVSSKTAIKITASKNAANCTYSTITVKNGSKKVEVTVIVSKTTTQHARVVTSGNRIKLFTAKNKLHGWLLFDVKKGTLNWNGYKLSGVKSCGFIQGSWNIAVLMKNGDVYKLPKITTKGQTIHKTRIKCEKGVALNRDTYGFVKEVKLKCGGLTNISGK